MPAILLRRSRRIGRFVARDGTACLARMLQRSRGDVVRSLAASNASPKAVARRGALRACRETTHYVAAILDRPALRSCAIPECS